MRFSKFNVVVPVALLGVLASTTAFAQEEAPAGDAPAAAEPTAPAEEAPAAEAAAAPTAATAGDVGGAPGVREHDGFYFRFGLGLGYLLGTSKPDEGPGGDTSVKGLAIPTELAFGGTIAPGLVIGGGSYGAFVPSPKAKPDGGEEADAGAITASGIGPFIDYYLNPKEGLHLQAALLLAYVQIAEKEVEGVTAPAAAGPGFGFMAGAGYEFWIGEQWSAGVLARVSYYNVKATLDVDGDPKIKFSGFVPGVLGTITYH